MILLSLHNNSHTVPYTVHDNFQQRKVLHAAKHFTNMYENGILLQHKDKLTYAVREQL